MAKTIDLETTKLSPKEIIHTMITINDHIRHDRLSKGEIKFLYDAVKLLQETQERFNFHTFCTYTGMSHDSFRQKVRKLKRYLDVVKSNPCTYSLKNTRLRYDKFQKITDDRMGEGAEIDRLLENVKEQPAKIHDIRLRFDSNVHHYLVKGGFVANPSNNQIFRDVSHIIDDTDITVKLQISSDHVQVMIGCTIRPLVYDTGGMLELVSLLGMIKNCLWSLVAYEPQVTLPSCSLWRLVHYHFGRDGTQDCAGYSFSCTFNDLTQGLIRHYTKILNGKNIIRAERIETPNITVMEQIAKIISAKSR